MARQRRSKPTWSFEIAAADIPPAGRRYELRPDEQTRAAVASLTGLRAVLRLEAQFEVRRHGADSLHVTGTVFATIGQTCVVSLEPIESEIEERVDLVFEPPAHDPAKPALGLGPRVMPARRQEPAPINRSAAGPDTNVRGRALEPLQEESGRAASVAGAEDGPEPLLRGRIDLGVIATEFLVLGIDQHPRKPEVVFRSPATEDDPATHPFAALAALKKREGGAES